MFEISKLKKVEKENVSIDLVAQEHSIYDNGRKVSHETFKTLSFDIGGHVGEYSYNFSFNLNCRLEELLKFPDGEAIDFNDYIAEGETILKLNHISVIEPKMYVKITRYLRNKYILFLTFYTTYDEEDYSGIIEIDFDLDKYMHLS